MRLFAPLLVGILLIGSTSPASGQTRLSVVGGGLVPFGEVGDTAEPSVAVGFRAELQPVNALGQRRLLTFHIGGLYSALDLEAAHELALSNAGLDKDAYLMEVNGGMRAYSRVAPFFVSGSAGYTRYSPAGSVPAVNGVNLAAGVGFLAPLPVAVVEVEGRLHQVFAEEGVDFQYLTIILGLGLPF